MGETVLRGSNNSGISATVLYARNYLVGLGLGLGLGLSRSGLGRSVGGWGEVGLGLG